MPHFYCDSQNTYVSTNFKVMWSTLKNREELRKIRGVSLFFQKLKENMGIAREGKHYLLVRDPYARVESFFRDKLRKHVDDSAKWQRSQRIFFPLLGLNKNLPPRQIQEALQAFSFEHFIKALPRVYRKDPHLYPQHWVEYFGPQQWGWRMPFSNCLKIEEPEAIRTLERTLYLDFGPPQNSTRDMKEQLQWTPELRKIVQQIYEEDFNRYGYSF